MAVVTALLADEAGGGIGGAGVHLANHSAVVAVVGQQPVDQARRPEWSGRSGACAWSAGSARSGTRPRLRGVAVSGYEADERYRAMQSSRR